MTAITALPLTEAVMVALWEDDTVPAVAVKVAVVAAAATVTEAGIVRTVLLSERATAVPPAGAVFDSVTVQVLVPFEFRLVGEQVSEERVTAVTRLTDAVCDAPLSVAVTVAV
jgi:hypothetical protein